MKKFEMVISRRNARISHNQRKIAPSRALDLKAKDLIGSDQTLLFISQS